MRSTSHPALWYLALTCLVCIPVLLCMVHDAQPNDANGSNHLGTGRIGGSASDPVLSAPGLNATFGYANRTTFNFTITYQSNSNATPSYVNLTIVHENWTASQVMVKVNPLAENFIAGVKYKAVLTFPTIGNYSHYFTASNGTEFRRFPYTGSIAGPSIVWLRNYTMNVVPFKWLNSSAAIEPINNYVLMYDYDLQFSFPMYGQIFTKVQVSYYGFLRFLIHPFDVYNVTARYPINVARTDSFSQYAIVGWSDNIWNYVSSGQSDLKVLSTAEYFLVDQQIWLNVSSPILYNASLQYVLYKNGTILLNYDYVEINFAVNETVGINYGDGKFYTPHSFSQNFTHKSLLFNYNYLTCSRIANYSLTPLTGTQVTAFNFSLSYQNLENRAPYSITLTFNGVNYTMSQPSTIDTNYVDGSKYVKTLQFLTPGSYNHSFHVLTPDGWWHSPVFHSPNVTYSNTHSPTIENLAMNPTKGWIGYTNLTITFTYKDLDNDPAANVSFVFNVSNIIHVLYPLKVSSSDNITFDGCTYLLDLRYTNTSFLYDANLKYYVFANDSSFSTRYPLNPGTWLDGPTFVPRLNYSSGKLLHFESFTLTSPTYLNSTNSVTITLPFNITFYGLPFSSLVFSPYGFIRFTTNTATTRPILGSKVITSQLSISLLNRQFQFSYYSTVSYQILSDMVVFDFYDIYSSSFLGDFMIILHKNGSIVFSFYDLRAGPASGINFGDGLHYTAFPLNQTDLPMVNVSYIFMQPKANPAVTSNLINGTLFKTSEEVGMTVNYASPTNVPVIIASCLIEGIDFRGITIYPSTRHFRLVTTGFTSYISGAVLRLDIYLLSGKYNITMYLIDLFGTRFNTTVRNVTVNNPPTVLSLEPISTYGGVGRILDIVYSYSDLEGLSPEYFQIRWDGDTLDLDPQSLIFSQTVTFSRSFPLTHGTHTFAIVIKDLYWPEQTLSSGQIIVKHLPSIEVISFPPTNIMVPGSFVVKVRITSLEPGFDLLSKYVRVNGLEQIRLNPIPGESSTYSASIPLDWGTYELQIVAFDGFNEVVYPAEGATTVTVINLPLIFGLAIGAVALVAIFLFVQSKQRKVQAAQQARLRQQVLAKKPTRRDIAESVEEKRKERQKEVQELDAIDVVQPAPAPVKKSAAVKRATSPATSTSPTTAPTKVSKPTHTSGTQQKDKSGYSQNAVETGTPVNRTIVKEYIERKRKEGARELHYIQIKNDLNIISQKKSSKLYRVLQDLVEDEILVRKGSNYVIVG